MLEWRRKREFRSGAGSVALRRILCLVTWYSAPLHQRQRCVIEFRGVAACITMCVFVWACVCAHGCVHMLWEVKALRSKSGRHGHCRGAARRKPQTMGTRLAPPRAARSVAGRVDSCTTSQTGGFARNAARSARTTPARNPIKHSGSSPATLCSRGQAASVARRVHPATGRRPADGGRHRKDHR